MDGTPDWKWLEAVVAEKGWVDEMRQVRRHETCACRQLFFVLPSHHVAFIFFAFFEAAPFRARARHFDGRALQSGKGSVVLWRDTFGWCPFCLPTQLLLEEKRVPYTTKKVPLRSYMHKDKPVDFLQRVDNGLVPDLTLDYGEPSERTICPPEGYDLFPFIEETYPEPRMAPPTGSEELAASYGKQSEGLQTAIRDYIFASGKEALSSTRSDLLHAMRGVDDSLGHCPGPYLFGDNLTLADLTLIPWLERCDALPRFFRGEELLDSCFPRLMLWLTTLRKRPTYKTLRLDDESLCVSVQNAVAFFTQKHLPFRLLGGHVLPLADLEAGPSSSRGPGSPAALEAAHALTYCRDGVLNIAGDPPTNTSATPGERMGIMVESMTTTTLAATGKHAVTDKILRQVAFILIHGDRNGQNTTLLQTLAGEHASEVSNGLVFLRNRIQVPRDMTAPAAATLRDVLFAAAVSLTGEEMALSLLVKHQGPYQSRRDVRSRF
jgi:glutathione S-transferase